MKIIARIFSHIPPLNIFEIVLTAVLAVALGVAFWGWTFIYELAKPALKLAGLSYLAAGFWILSSVLLPHIVRKPGIALFASVMAAFIEGLLTHWGPMALVWGFVQGLGAEVIFFIFFYRKWNLGVLMLAGGTSALFSYGLDYFYYGYHSLSLRLNLMQLGSFVVSAIFLAGVLSHFLAKRLMRLGILESFLIAKDRHV